MNQSPENVEYRLLLKTLREVAKAKKFTSSRIAKALSVSEVTVKRWFTGHTCSIETLFKICSVLEISFFDLTTLAKKEDEVDYVLSPEQEVFFSKNLGLFGIFKHLHRGRPAAWIAEHWKLSSKRLFGLLRLLEKQGLIEVFSENKIRMKVRGNIRYQHQGPLGKVLLRPQILQFLDQVDKTLKQDDVCLHSAEVELSFAHVEEFVEEIHALGKKYRARAFRDRSLLANDRLKSVRWLLAFAPYETDWRHYKL